VKNPYVKKSELIRKTAELRRKLPHSEEKKVNA
jgi:hypothetical protein